jgi:hypothetical protein
MELSPGLHPLHGARAAEVIAVAVFAEPAALAGELAGLLTFPARTIPLPIRSARIRKKKPAAMTAFTPGWRAAHEEPKLRRIQESRKRKRRPPRSRSQNKEEELSARSGRRKCPGRKRNFKPLVSLHFHSAADSAYPIQAKKVISGYEQVGRLFDFGSCKCR